MERRSWPWKKKSSDKATAADKAVGALEAICVSSASNESPAVQDNYKKPRYVQISVESYSHLSGLEDQVKTYEDQVKAYEDHVETLESEITELNEKLSAADTEMTTKESLVKQHAKVAEEAVSGWEKAEAEALTLKNQLESVTLQKLTVEDRASHLDGALKECMRQIRNLKEEHEHKLQEAFISKTKQLEKMKLEFESKMSKLDQELLRSAAENTALSRSLQERSNMLVKMSEEKSQAEAEIEHLRNTLESCEREINSFKYELHIASKELEIRNEEKNMSVRSAEVANKQHLEGVKKITKLEAECQRLRGLVRKKLPGPAALAQMKLEVDNLGRDYGEIRHRRSSIQPPSPSRSPSSDFSIDVIQKFQKENEFLTERLLAMEEETKMLKEALAHRNSELQDSRNECAKTASNLQSLEAQLQNHKRSPISQNASNPPSFMSEDGNDDATSCADSWATPSSYEISRNKKEKIEKSRKGSNTYQLELMDDFLEMEKLACEPNDSHISISDISTKKINDNVNHDFKGITTEIVLYDPLANQESSNLEKSPDPKSDSDTLLPMSKHRSRVSIIFDSIFKESDMGKIVEDIKFILHDFHDTLHQQCGSCVFDGLLCSKAQCDKKSCPENGGMAAEKEISLSPDSKPIAEHDKNKNNNPELAAAISQIQDFVQYLGKEAMMVRDSSPDSNGYLNEEIEEFSVSLNKALYGEVSVVDFVIDLSHVFSKASEFRSFSIMGYNKSIVDESLSSDCIDKVALPESKVVQNDSVVYQRGCSNSHISDSASDTDIPSDGAIVPSFATCKCQSEEFEQMKTEKENMAMDLINCTETLEITKAKMNELEQHIVELKSKLGSAQNSNSLAETQLKCMAESYRSLEARARELENEVSVLRGKIDNLDIELQEEKKNHYDALARCEDLQNQLNSFAADADVKTKEERELAAAAEKLAECQETMFLLGKQLKLMRPQPETHLGSPFSERTQKGEAFFQAERTNSGMILHDFDQSEMDIGFANLHRNGYNPTYIPSDTESNFLLRSPHRPTKSSSSSSSSNPTPEKPSRGISRFFSSKGKIDH